MDSYGWWLPKAGMVTVISSVSVYVYATTMRLLNMQVVDDRGSGDVC